MSPRRSVVQGPCIYLTAYCDENTIDRAKISDPFGYLVKPFAERELCVAIEMALFRHRAETTMAERERWFEATLNCIGDAVLATDVEGHIVFLNPLAETLTGWKSREAAGKHLREVVPLLDIHTRAPVEVPTPASLARSREIDLPVPTEMLLRTHEGTDRLVLCRMSLIREPKGKLDGMVLALNDISERREMERHKLDRERMEALGKIAASISHEFYSLLTLIGGHASSLTDHLLPNTRAYEDTLRIQDATRRATALAKRILGIVRVTHASGDIRLEPVPLSEAVPRTVALVERPFSERRIQFAVQAPESMPVVIADADQLPDLLMDLFLVSADALPEGGTIEIEASAKRIAKPDRKANPHAKPGRYAVLRIQHAGKGIPGDALEHIFEPFLARDQARPGHGLSVVQTAIQRYGGWLKATSRPWRGTAYSLFLPESVKPSRRATAKAARTPHARILVVDDRDELLTEIRSMLTEAGYQVLAAGGGEEAISLVQQRINEIDLALVDVIMPGRDGRQVLQAILDLDPAAPVIMTSGFSRDYVRSYLPPGAWRFLQKPFDKEQLLAAVSRGLAQGIT